MRSLSVNLPGRFDESMDKRLKAAAHESHLPNSQQA